MSQENGTAEKEKGPSILETIHAEWVKKGSKKPDVKTIAQLKKAIEEVELDIQEAEKALQAAQDRRYAVALKAMQALGTKTELDTSLGRLAPTGRKDRVFYKRVGARDTV